MLGEHHYLVAGTKPWNRRIFTELISAYSGAWHYIGGPEELRTEQLAEIKPRYLFFLHWSAKVPHEIVTAYECVCFHMADVPYGRGGSPLQNLILRGHRHTKLTALRMGDELDGGPIYLQEDLCLEGSAEEIYLRATRLAARMIGEIVRLEPVPRPQEGIPTCFARRRPEESRIPAMASLALLHDFIRMLDAEGYPHAFLEHEGFRYEFRRAGLYDGRILADVKITRIPEELA